MFQLKFEDRDLIQLGKVTKAIVEANKFEAHQMKCLTLVALNNASESLDDMSVEERTKLQLELLDQFRSYGWIK